MNVTAPTFGIIVTAVDAVVVEPLHPLAVTVTVAVPVNVDDHVTVPDELIVPAPAGLIDHP